MAIFGLRCVNLLSFCLLPTLAPCPLLPTFNQLPIAVQVWNLVQSFFRSESREVFFLDFLIFPGGSMVLTFNKLSLFLQVWNLVQSFFNTIWRDFFFLGFLNLEFLPLFYFSKITDLFVSLQGWLNPTPIIQTYNQLPIAIQVWNLVQGFFTSITLTNFFGL